MIVEKFEAAHALGQLGDPRAVAPLIQALRDADGGVRREAAHALGQLGDSRVVEVLIQALHDADGGVRREAAHALGQLGDPRAVAPLIQALHDADSEVRWEAARTLRQLGDPRIVAPLIQALYDAERTAILGDVRSSEPAAHIQFTAYHPKEVKPETWYTLLAYAHLPEALAAVQSDSRTRLGPQAGNAGQGRSQATQTIARGAEMAVVPELPGCRFNPPRASFLWLEDWHRTEFRVKATPDLPDFTLGQAVNGRVAFYVGPVLVAEVPIWTHFQAEADVSAAALPDTQVTTDSYQRIFLSYSHQDALVAQQVERAYTVLGMQSLRDVHALRSGEEWHPALLRHIEQADVFQLFWSHNAKHSTYVEYEWRFALTQARPSFIRPLYWEQPMSDPPPELAAIHFAYFPLDQLCTKSSVRNLTHRLIRTFWSIFACSYRSKSPA